MTLKEYVRANMWKIISLYLLCVLAFVTVYNNIAVTNAYNEAYKAGCWNSFADMQNAILLGNKNNVTTTVLNITPGTP